MMKRIICLVLAAVLLLATAMAAPSITELEQECLVTIVAEDEALAQLLAGESIYTSRALVEQYEGAAREVILRAEQTYAETGTNGHTIAESIPSVAEIFADASYSGEADLAALHQLTYMQDFKFESTGYRVIAKAGQPAGFEATIEGGELMKSAASEDFLILQLDLESGELHEVELKAYDAETGVYTADFHCFGPYMVTLR